MSTTTRTDRPLASYESGSHSRARNPHSAPWVAKQLMGVMAMSEFDDEQFTNDSEGMAALRKHARALEKSLKEQSEALKAYQAKEARGNLESTFSKKGYPAGLAKLYHGDDHSEEAVLKWVEENKDLFNIQPPQAEGEETPPAEVQSTTSAEDRAAAMRMQALTAGSSPSAAAPFVEEVTKAPTPHDLTKFLQANGMTVTGG